MHSAKPSFANHKMFQSELGEDYVIASCYNGLLLRRRRLYPVPPGPGQYREAS
ncbi:MAG: glycyl radical enzyme domain-containing protein [Clostridium sp.]